MRAFFFILFLFLSINLCTQRNIKTLKTHTFPEVEKLQKIAPKPIVIFLYTDWCKICFGMKKNTFQNSKVIEKLNSDYYFVMLNGEEKSDITFLGKTFSYKPSGNSGIHELANQLTISEDKISYPTTIILNSDYEIDALFDGYLNSKKMNLILNKYLK
jgi:thioredoxin-related protein